MCRHAVSPLPPVPHSAPAARDFLRQCLSEWELMALYDDARVALTELVTNAIVHARTPLVVSVSSEQGWVEIAVFDGSPTLPQARPPRVDLDADLALLLDAEAGFDEHLDERDPRLDIGAAGSVAGGRGLLVVDALVAEWGVSPLSDGKAVWVRTPAPEDWPHADGCPCPTAASATTLASGHRAAKRAW